MDYKETLNEQGLIITAPCMKEIYKKAALLAGNQVSVLIYGESGVGKTHLAEYIQKHSPQPQSPFIAIHCNAISSELFASELFGYSPNAFTGASPKGKIGLLEAANHGTVLFDEINELSPENQTLLLHFLQNKTITPIGSLKSKAIDTRVICTSGRSLLEMIQEGTFRVDLYYRICVANIFIPPIRQRREEIPAFLNYFVKQFASELNCTPSNISISEDTMKQLCSLPWQGNIREIENLAQYICLSDHTDQVIRDHIRIEEDHKPSVPSPQPSPGKEQRLQDLALLFSSSSPVMPLKEVVEKFEQAYIQNALSKTSSLKEAAQALNISFSTLCRKKREL